ncbi:Mutator mutT protein (7,8-dihydro-8-oxoguanine-triphosphatase) / Thiamin-phosphate pyrophosphorylase-like protein [hydrothermal vent metagenome]|uniref:8-oxo-dGTP diphosphatase n=1 Tax=hydrothermal vent metagenome TaxID=652676 RepID=A0A3B0WWW0_9ZZZZ
MSKIVHVVIAIIVNQQQQVLIALRDQNAHLGGLWEFPGGKVEPGESAFDALTREIHEELNLSISHAYPINKIKHCYADKTILLDVWQVESYLGEPQSAEGQPIKWQPISQLEAKYFPEANASIIHSLQLPDQYMITGDFENIQEFSLILERSLSKGILLVQLRSKQSSSEEYKELVKISSGVCKKYNAQLVLNTDSDIYCEVGNASNGLHLSSKMLKAMDTRPISDELLLSVSCHNPAEIEKAKQLKANIILLSPVKETTSHPGVRGIGWKKFNELATEINVPVYALGGMTPVDLSDAKSFGAQGIAAISSFWK